MNHLFAALLELFVELVHQRPGALRVEPLKLFAGVARDAPGHHADRRPNGQQKNHQQLCAKTHGLAPVAASLEGPGAPAAADSARSSQTSSRRHAPQRRGIQSRTAAPSPTVSGR